MTAVAEPGELVERRKRLVLCDAGRDRGKLGIERVACDRRTLEHPAVARVQDRQLGAM